MLKPFNFSIAKALTSVYPDIGLDERMFVMRQKAQNNHSSVLYSHKRGICFLLSFLSSESNFEQVGTGIL